MYIKWDSVVFFKELMTLFTQNYCALLQKLLLWLRNG